MTLRRRLRVIVAALRQQWHVFTCPRCKAESYICGHAPDLAGMLCQNCEAEDHAIWLEDFYRRDGQRQERSA